MNDEINQLRQAGVPEGLMKEATSHVPPAAPLAGHPLDTFPVPADDAKSTYIPPSFTAAPVAPIENLAGLAEPGVDEMGRKTTFIGELGKRLLEKFLGDNRTAWEKLQADERALKQAESQFKWFQKRIAESKMLLDALREQIAQYTPFSETHTMGDCLFENWAKKGNQLGLLVDYSFLSHLVLADLVTRNKERIIARAEAEHAALGDQYREFCRVNRVILKQLKLI